MTRKARTHRQTQTQTQTRAQTQTPSQASRLLVFRIVVSEGGFTRTLLLSFLLRRPCRQDSASKSTKHHLGSFCVLTQGSVAVSAFLVSVFPNSTESPGYSVGSLFLAALPVVSATSPANEKVISSQFIVRSAIPSCLLLSFLIKSSVFFCVW